MTNITFTTTEIQELAQKNARRYGVSVSQYVSRLVVADNKPRKRTIAAFPVEKDWGPVPKKVLKRWEREEKEFEKEEQKGLHKTFHTVEELMRDLNS